MSVSSRAKRIATHAYYVDRSRPPALYSPTSSTPSKSTTWSRPVQYAALVIVFLALQVVVCVGAHRVLPWLSPALARLMSHDGPHDGAQGVNSSEACLTEDMVNNVCNGKNRASSRSLREELDQATEAVVAAINAQMTTPEPSEDSIVVATRPAKPLPTTLRRGGQHRLRVDEVKDEADLFQRLHKRPVSSRGQWDPSTKEDSPQETIPSHKVNRFSAVQRQTIHSAIGPAANYEFGKPTESPLPLHRPKTLPKSVNVFRFLCEGKALYGADAGAAVSSELAEYRQALHLSYQRYEAVRVNHTLRRMIPPTVNRRLVRNTLEQRTEPAIPARVRFVSATTSVDRFTHRAITGAIVSGVPLELIGIGWEKFTLPQRFEVLLSYIESAQLRDHDVIVMMDNDAMFVGEDPYPAVEAFVSLSPSSEAELTNVRAIRLNRRMAPIRFSAENNCMRRQVVDHEHCREDYDLIEVLMKEWAAHNNLAYLSNKGAIGNPMRYLNSGFMIARVWAIKRFIPAFRQFMAEHTPLEESHWNSDQSVTATLYLQLRWWEIISGALDDMHLPVTNDDIAMTHLAVKPVLPVPNAGPYGLPGGLIDLDEVTRWSGQLSTAGESRDAWRVFNQPIRRRQTTVERFSTFSRMNEQRLKEESEVTPDTVNHVGAVVLPYLLQPSQRVIVDCLLLGANLPHCFDLTARNAALGLPPDAPVHPLIWHFAGDEKELTFFRYSYILPWRMPLDFSDTAKDRIMQIMWAADPVKMWTARLSDVVSDDDEGMDFAPKLTDSKVGGVVTYSDACDATAV